MSLRAGVPIDTGSVKYDFDGNFDADVWRWCQCPFAALIIGDLFPFSKPFNKVNVLKRLTGKLCHRRGPLPKI